MSTTRARTAATAVLAGGLLLAGAAPAAACRPADPTDASNPDNAVYWEYDGLYDCSKAPGPGTRSYTKPDGVAFVVIKTGREYFVSDLGDSNDGDRTYTFDRRIRFVISCLFTDQ